MRDRPAAGFIFSFFAIAACSSMRGPPPPVPEGAENPIEIRFKGASVTDAVDIVSRVMSDMAIATLQVDHSSGYVETRWIDVAAFVQFPGAYPYRERQVQYQFRASEQPQQVRRLVIAAVYRPNLVDRDRVVPTDHPGYRIALRMEGKIRRALIEARATVLKDGGG